MAKRRNRRDEPQLTREQAEQEVLEELLHEQLAKEGVEVGDIKNYSLEALQLALAAVSPKYREPFRMAWNFEAN